MQILNIIHVLVAIAMVAFILVQRGPGATAGAAFGSGASGTVFGSRGAGSFLSHATWVLAALFCLISLTMAVLVTRDISTPDTDLGVMGSPTVTEQSVPAFEAPESDAPLGDLPAFEEELLMEDAEELQAIEQDLESENAGSEDGSDGPSD